MVDDSEVDLSDDEPVKKPYQAGVRADDQPPVVGPMQGGPDPCPDGKDTDGDDQADPCADDIGIPVDKMFRFSSL